MTNVLSCIISFLCHYMFGCNQKERVRKHNTLTDFNKPRRPWFSNLPHTHRPPSSLTLKLPADSFVCPLQFEDMQTQQHDRPHNIHLLSCSFTLMPSEETLSSHCRLCTFPESISTTFHQTFTKHQIRCCLVSLTLSLKFLCNNS
jgi:hypothetical protein